MKEVLLTATYLVGAGELILAWYFLKTNSGNEIRKVMALFTLSVALWVLSSAYIGYRPASDFTLIVNKAIYVFGVSLVTLLLHLSLIFPYRIHAFDRLHWIFLYVPTVIFSAIALGSDAITSGFFANADVAGKVIRGPLNSFYNVYLLILYVVSVVVLSTRLRKLGDIYVRLLLIGVLIGGLPAVMVDLILPLVAPNNLPNYLWGNLFTSAWLGITLYAVARKV